MMLGCSKLPSSAVGFCFGVCLSVLFLVCFVFANSLADLLLGMVLACLSTVLREPGCSLVEASASLT